MCAYTGVNVVFNALSDVNSKHQTSYINTEQIIIIMYKYNNHNIICTMYIYIYIYIYVHWEY